MRIRSSALAASVALLLLAVSPLAAAAGSSAPATAPPPVVCDSASTEGAPGAVLNVRAAYETAYSQRRAGDPMSAIGAAEAALLQIEVALSEDPDAQTRRDLIELRSKLSGLRDSAESDLQTPERKVEPGNEPDDRVLNAPAVEGIQPQ